LTLSHYTQAFIKGWLELSKGIAAVSGRHLLPLPGTVRHLEAGPVRHQIIPKYDVQFIDSGSRFELCYRKSPGLFLSNNPYPFLYFSVSLIK
jgi:hypothetical protein